VVVIGAEGLRRATGFLSESVDEKMASGGQGTGTHYKGIEGGKVFVSRHQSQESAPSGGYGASGKRELEGFLHWWAMLGSRYKFTEREGIKG